MLHQHKFKTYNPHPLGRLIQQVFDTRTVGCPSGAYVQQEILKQ